MSKLVLVLLLIGAASCRTDQKKQDACQTFISSKQVKDLIEVKKKLIPSCPCLKQQIDLDYSYEKVGDCYRSWNFEDGVKQMCCYSSDGNLLVVAPHGGYMLFEDQWKNMDDIKGNCCLEDDTCQLFYEINPSDDCTSYKPPVTVTSIGDPYIETIDGNKYNFNGHGEYVFLKTSDLEIQVRLGYITPGNKDSTHFEAFAIFDYKSGETFEIHNNRSSQKLRVYRDGKIFCNSTVKERREPCEMPPQKGHCIVLTDGIKVAIFGCGVRFFANAIAFTPGEFMDVSMTPRRGSDSTNITGLAGHQKDGKFIFRNGTEVETNSTRILFDYGESWSLANESESLFNYSLTGGNFTFYNNHHSRPRFIEDLVGNLTALFQGYPEANISLINATCRNDWDNRPNEECLLTIATTKQFNLGVAVMKTVNEDHLNWEILHNKPPYFLGNMTDNIKAVYKQDANITIDLKQFVGDDQPVDTLSFHIKTQLPPEEFSLDKGVFSWNVGTGLRYLDTSLTFFVIDRLNASARHDVTINYCGCEKQSECKFNTENSYSSNVDECAEGYSGRDKCEHICNNTDGSFNCSCRSGYTLNSNRYSCDDIDECSNGAGICKQEHTYCQNTKGGYECLCVPGYENSTGTCKQNDGRKYVGSMTITIYASQKEAESLNKTIDTFEKREEFQNKLDKGFYGTEGYQSVKVLSIMVISTNRVGREAGKEQYYLKVEYVVTWVKNKTVDDVASRELEQSFQKNVQDGHLDLGNVRIHINTATSDVKSGNDSGFCSVPDLINCDLTSMTCTDVPGSYKCECRQGFVSRGSNDYCADAIECQDSNSQQCSNGECRDTYGGFTCDCHNGFSLNNTDERNPFCQEIDECDEFLKNGTIEERCAHGTCKNIPGTWVCICPRNRTWQSVGNNSYAMYRCQGDYQYIGKLTLLWQAPSVSNKSVETFVNKTITKLFLEKYNDSIALPKGQPSMREIFLSVDFLNATFENIAEIFVRTNASFVLHLGEAVRSEWVSEILSKLFNQTSKFTSSTNVSVNVLTSSILNDIDKCKQGQGLHTCSNGGICVNTDGNWTCKCPHGYTSLYINETYINCTADVDGCLTAVNKCKESEICVDAVGSHRCECGPGFSRRTNNGPCVQNGNLTLEGAVDVKCSNTNWDVSINMDIVRSLYPSASHGDIYLGQPQCQGRLANSTLTFQYSLEACQTKEITSEVTKFYTNKLFNVVFDPITPFLIRRHIWTFAIECDVIRGGTGTSHLHHGIESHHSTFVNRYNVTVELFKDQNFQYPLSEGSQTIRVGDDVYVKVSTSISDWNTKMRLHTCFTNPSKNATADMEVLLIRNGCEVGANTHIMSQSTHETRFVFQDFEYVTNEEGLDIYCNATFCDSKDYSPGCVQSCYQNPTLIG